ncbi:RRM_1 domain-containing protein, partial [Cephalotus follicularis]
MDLTKKRKLEENGVVDADPNTKLTPEDARKLIDRLTHDQLLDILQHAVSRHADVLEAVRSIADADSTQRKLFVRGLGWDTTTDNLRNLFSAFGELEEAVVILDKQTNKSKGYGFVTYKHVDGALLALKEPSKKIDGRVTVTQLAAAGNTGQSVNSADVSMRKIYVANVPFEMPPDKLLAHFSLYGEIEEGPLGFDKLTGKSKGFALFVYKTSEGAQAALVDPVKTIDGRQLNCKLAIDGKKKPGPGQAPSSLGSGGYGAGLGGPYGGYGVPGSAAYSGLGGTGGGSSLYRLPPSGGMPSGGYPDAGHAGHYSLSASSGFPNQGTSPAPRVPPGGMYPNVPPYY